MPSSPEARVAIPGPAMIQHELDTVRDCIRVLVRRGVELDAEGSALSLGVRAGVAALCREYGLDFDVELERCAR